jgi:hypothetical protein
LVASVREMTFSRVESIMGTFPRADANHLARQGNDGEELLA